LARPGPQGIGKDGAGKHRLGPRHPIWSLAPPDLCRNVRWDGGSLWDEIRLMRG
jgi:hypothetical protein